MVLQVRPSLFLLILSPIYSFLDAGSMVFVTVSALDQSASFAESLHVCVPEVMICVHQFMVVTCRPVLKPVFLTACSSPAYS
jgi:hypothetical protein